MQDSARTEEAAFAHVIWAAHILWFLSANRSQQDLISENLDDDFEESDDTVSQDGTDTENLGLLSSSDDGVRVKFLNALAELLSPQKGWHHVSATALRENEDGVEIDLARNGGFGSKESRESQADAKYMAALHNFMAMQSNAEQGLGTDGDRCHEFLRATIAYNSRRVDKYIDDACEAFKQSQILDLLPKFEILDQEKDHQRELTCTRDYRTETPPDYADLRELINILGNAKTPDLRYRVVALAEKLSSHALLHNIVSRSAGGGRMEKLKRSLAFLARPITTLRLLIETARLVPSFRNIKFCCVKPSKSIRILEKFRTTAKEAWVILGLPDYDAHIRKSLEEKMHNFKSLCSRSFSAHAEVQLVSHYQENPRLLPTLDYIGCSKRACLLCEAFLQASPQKFRIRGRHGGCYPSWGVSESHLKPFHLTLNQISQHLKQRIVQLLNTDSSALGQAVPQSTIVSDFNSLDLKGIKNLENTRESLQSNIDTLREKTARFNDPRSRGPTNIWYTDINTLCIICQFPGARACARCRSCGYCSKLCQEADWPSHKLLCATYSKPTSRPIPESRLAIWFPDTSTRPRLVWAGLQKDSSLLVPYFNHFLGEDHGVHWTIIFNNNQRRGLSLGYDLTLYYDDAAGVIGLPVNKSVRAAAGKSAPIPHEWCGPLVLLRGNPAYGFGDVTLADYRHVLDYFVTYWDTNLREEPSSNTAWGVKVNCHGEQVLHGADKFVRVAVDRKIPGNFKVSSVSKLLNLPVKAEKVRSVDSWASYPEWSYDPDEYGSSTRPEQNLEAGSLFIDVDSSSLDWGRIPKEWEKDIGNVLLLRDDGKDMSLEEAEALCLFCTQVLVPLFNQYLSGEVPRSDVLRYLTVENFNKFRLSQR